LIEQPKKRYPSFNGLNGLKPPSTKKFSNAYSKAKLKRQIKLAHKKTKPQKKRKRLKSNYLAIWSLREENRK
jgi:hypothetical protein